MLLDLFCGCGGFSLGAARAGFDIVGAVDNDSRALNTHRTNFPNVRHTELDISLSSGDELRTLLDLGDADINCVAGGPPCQGFSSMGKGDSEDPRNQLFAHFFRLVSELLPQFFVCENVPGILLSGHRKTIDAAFEYVNDRYVVLPQMRLCASAYGAPTSRTRVFFVGYRKSIDARITSQDFQPSPDTQITTVEQALTGLPTQIPTNEQNAEDGWRKVEAFPDSEFGRRLWGMIPSGMGDEDALRLLKDEKLVSGCIGTNHSSAVVDRFEQTRQGGRDAISKMQRLALDGLCPTLRAGTNRDRGSFQAVRPIHPVENRVITPREAARLQGFPDWFQFDPTKWHSFRQIGNSVCPIVAETVLAPINNAIVK